MNLTLRQLLPQLSGLIYVVQPKKGEKADLTIFYSDYDKNTYFSSDDLRIHVTGGTQEVDITTIEMTPETALTLAQAINDLYKEGE